MAKWKYVEISSVSRFTPGPIGRYEGVTFMQAMDLRKWKKLKRKARLAALRAIQSAQQQESNDG